MTTLIDYLASLPGVSNAAPISVTIKGTTFQGVRYVDTRHYDAGMAAVQRGERKAGEPYSREVIYLLGSLPAAYRRSTRIAFTVGNDPRDWYVAAYHDGKAGRFGSEPPKFGANFMLMPWEAGEPIDHYEILQGKNARPRIACALAA